LRTAQGNAFAFDLFYKILQTSDDKNVFISPLSVDFALGMTQNGANGVTEQEMKQVLHHSGLTSAQINEYYRIMLNALPAVDPTTKLNIANSIWCREGFPFHQSFLDVNAKYFDAEVRNLDFASPTALQTINDWCARQTNNLIQEALDQISPDAVMYLINAIYFKGVWTTQFDRRNTAKATFFAENGSENQVYMMRIFDNSFPYYTNTTAQFLDMSYGNGAFSMTVILPHNGKTLQDVTDNLSSDYFNDIVENRLHERNVEVFFPRFKTEYRIELQDLLSAMGMPSAFCAFDADFSGISEIPLFISRVIHSTFVEVNEEGTEAAAVTVVETAVTSVNPSQPVLFRADRPFMFVIRENSTGAVLFMGKMGDI
jgi:serpin B